MSQDFEILSQMEQTEASVWNRIINAVKDQLLAHVFDNDSEFYFKLLHNKKKPLNIEDSQDVLQGWLRDVQFTLSVDPDFNMNKACCRPEKLKITKVACEESEESYPEQCIYFIYKPAKSSNLSKGRTTDKETPTLSNIYAMTVGFESIDDLRIRPKGYMKLQNPSMNCPVFIFPWDKHVWLPKE